MTDQQIRILLADDEPGFIDPMAFWLKSRGYDVTTVKNGKEAVERIKSDPPDILFIDYKMPEMDGRQALREIRLFNKDLPVVMLTSAFEDKELVDEVKTLGISAFFSKTYSFDQLSQMIQMILKTHKKFQKPHAEH